MVMEITKPLGDFFEGEEGVVLQGVEGPAEASDEESGGGLIDTKGVFKGDGEIADDKEDDERGQHEKNLWELSQEKDRRKAWLAHRGAAASGRSQAKR